MKRAGKTFNAIIALLLAGGVISVGNRAFAQEEGGKAWLKEKPTQTLQSLFRETGAGKSYLKSRPSSGVGLNRV